MAPTPANINSMLTTLEAAVQNLRIAFTYAPPDPPSIPDIIPADVPTPPVVLPSPPVTAPVTPPIPPVVTLPVTVPALVQKTALTYIRSFALPHAQTNGRDFGFAGGTLALGANGDTLFMTSRDSYVAEVSIPQDGELSTFVQPFTDPTDGTLGSIGSTDGDYVSGLLAVGSDLLVSGVIYYDAGNVQRVSHMRRPANLSVKGSDTAFSTVWQSDHEGFVAGYMANVPSAWQTKLGGPAITGQFGLPVVSRTSWGPAAFSFDPSQIGSPTVPASPLVYYDGDHHTIGDWNGSNPVYGGTTKAGGLVLTGGSALFFGRNGIGKFGYGPGTSDPALDGQPVPGSSDVYCYDPTSGDKGQHAYPYQYQVWAYDLNDFTLVAAGLKQPWSVIPYSTWGLTFPTTDANMIGIGGAAIDSTGLIYVSQLRADLDGGYAPMIHVYQVQ